MAKKNFIQRIFTGPEEKQIPNNMVGYFGVGSGDSKNYKYQDLANEGYMKNAIVFRCVNEIS